MIIEEAEEAVLDQAVQERCIKQLVQTVKKKLKFLLCPVVTDLCTAKNVTKNINPRDINPNTHLRH
jgi:hypothetical protein